ncbi:YdcF family protein [Ancylobacter sp. 6x-1]|uniref:YdcF family protein n=1 Tax=Ancylobacter crimeensis TaxID=2579147 RepID=A0ABT0DD18_9HYPH|nr:YdcF family protein [Ancylobacter crimeensis]MCK0197840.1 YdcF family protein [Ancylobacter crimeensis]
MSVPGPDAPEPASATAPARIRTRPRRRVRILQLLALFAVMGVLALLAGFLVFASAIQIEEVPLARDADGIVVLTGGSDRLVDATNLLTEGRGRRLLITGVHRDTTLGEIARNVPAEETALTCCVDIGKSALNTRGNALETAAWARHLGFRSLIVVTSTWHMPRALVELRRAAPEIEMIAYPVVSQNLKNEPWWTSPASLRLLVLEYVKYLAANAKIRLLPATTQEEARRAQ